jgi:hypothetical protein
MTISLRRASGARQIVSFQTLRLRIAVTHVRRGNLLRLKMGYDDSNNSSVEMPKHFLKTRNNAAWLTRTLSIFPSEPR